MQGASVASYVDWKIDVVDDIVNERMQGNRRNPRVDRELFKSSGAVASKMRFSREIARKLRSAEAPCGFGPGEM